MTESNYEVAKRDAAALFCQTDHSAPIKHFGLSEQNGYLYLQFFEQPFRLNKETGIVQRYESSQNSWREAQFNESMAIYDLLGYAQPTCHASGILANMKSIHLKMVATAPNSNNFYRNQESLFAQHPEALQQALTSLGGRAATGKADVGAQFTCIADLNMEVHFWLPDDDFPASLQFYWDENVLQYMHYETIWYANAFIMKEIEREFKRLA